MRHPGVKTWRDSSALRVHLLGQVEFAAAHQLQQRLIYEAGEQNGPAATLLVCEHPPLITVGRLGSRSHVRIGRQELIARQVEMVWINRGGGCIFHSPGQLAIYPVVALEHFGWTVGHFMQRISGAMQQALDRLQIATRRPAGQFGIWGRSGLLAACGVGVHYGVTCHGYYLNVHPPMGLMRQVETAYSPDIPATRRAMSSLLVERGVPVRMPRIRTAIVEAVAGALDRPRFHLQTGHLYLTSQQEIPSHVG